MYILKVDASNKDKLRGLFCLTFYVVLDYDIPENGDPRLYKNRKTGTRDPSGTLKKSENLDPGP